jgi:hypothetical protein
MESASYERVRKFSGDARRQHAPAEALMWHHRWAGRQGGRVRKCQKCVFGWSRAAHAASRLCE